MSYVLVTVLGISSVTAIAHGHGVLGIVGLTLAGVVVATHHRNLP